MLTVSIVMAVWLLGVLGGGASSRHALVLVSRTTAVASSSSNDTFAFIYTTKRDGSTSMTSGLVNLQDDASEGRTVLTAREGTAIGSRTGEYVAIGTKMWTRSDKKGVRWIYNPDIRGAWLAEDGSIDPVNYLRQLTDASWHATHVSGARGNVDGASTKVYRAYGNVDDSYNETTVVEHLSLEMWVDGRGLLRRLHEVGNVQGKSTTRSALDFVSDTTFYKFGQPTEINAPAVSDVEPQCPAMKPNVLVPANAECGP